MYERFTDRARKVMQLANQEAQRFNHEYIGTEHVLLGLIKEGSGAANAVRRRSKIRLLRSFSGPTWSPWASVQTPGQESHRILMEKPKSQP